MADLPEAPKPQNPVDIQAQRAKLIQGRRDEVQRQANAGLQQNTDAIRRRMAAIGASGSGAEISANLKAQEQAAQQQRQGMQDIDAQETGYQESDANRAFQAQESEKARQAQEGQFARQLAFNQRGQDIGQEQFGKNFGLQQDQFGKTFGLQQRAQDIGQEQFGKQFGLEQQKAQDARDQFAKQYGLSYEQFLNDQLDNKFNLMGQYGMGDMGAAFTDRYGAYGSSSRANREGLGGLGTDDQRTLDAIQRRLRLLGGAA